MDQNEAGAILRTLRSELLEAKRIVGAAQRREAALEKLVSGYLELFPDLATEATVDATPNGHEPESGERKPRGQEAVLRILSSIEWKGRYWTLSAMTQALAERGWLPETKSDTGNPENAVRTALTRLVESNDRVSKGRGATGTFVYYYRHDGMPEPVFSGSPLSVPIQLRPDPARFASHQEAQEGSP
jgi:hypothetical protein